MLRAQRVKLPRQPQSSLNVNPKVRALLPESLTTKKKVAHTLS